MILNCISLVTLLFPVSSFSAEILGILPTPSYSHQVAYAGLWKELSLRGHKVTVITTDPQKNPELKNLTELDISWSYVFFKDISDKAENEMTLWNVYQILQSMSLEASRGQLSSPEIQDLIHKSGRVFDVVMVEFLYPEYLGFAEIHNCPKIVLSSLTACDSFHRFLFNPIHPVLYPHFIIPFYPPLSFKERVISTLYTWYLWYHHTYWYFPEREELLHEYFGNSLSLTELLSSVDMMFLNSNPAIQVPRPLGPTTIEVGDRRSVSAKSWEKDLKEFLDGAKDGFIYFSLGSNVKSKELGTQTLNSIIEVLSEVPYKVLWKFEADTLPGKPNNVKLVKWAPQQQVLAHPNIKLFVTQGGLQSMEEGIYSEVPFVVIPFFADQEQNANLLRSKGVARVVERKPFIKKEDLKSAILEVIENPSYRDEVRKLKRLALDTPMTGLEKAVWWTEYVIRNKGAKHLRNPAADIPSYQYYLLDVISFLFAVAALMVSFIILVLKYSIKWLKKYIFIRQGKVKKE